MHEPINRRSLLAGSLLAAQPAYLAAQAARRVLAPLRLPRKVRLGLIGLEGHIADVLGPLASLPDVELVAIASEDPKAMAEVAKNPSAAAAHQYKDYRSLLDHEKLDMVAACGPTGGREQILLACAERKLHIVAEKPLTFDRAGLERVKRAVTRNGIRLSMLLTMRFEAIYTAMKQIVASGEIGEVAQMSAQKSYKVGDRPEWLRNHATYGGTIPFIGIHMVDLMRYTSGRDLVETAAFQSRIGYPELKQMENTTSTVFRLDNNGTASLRMDYLRPEMALSSNDDRLRLAGTGGVLEYQQPGGLTLVTRKEKPRVITDLPAHRSLFMDFLDSVYNSKPVGLDLPDIYRANEIVFAARESAEQHRVIKI